MTRGKFAIILDDTIIKSIEFNGDMYPDNGYGVEAYKALVAVTNKESFDHMVKVFNKEHHNYTDIDNFTFEDAGIEQLNMSEDYFENWFSDWLFIKNLRSEKVLLELAGGREFWLGAGETVALSFGDLPDDKEQQLFEQVWEAEQDDTEDPEVDELDMEAISEQVASGFTSGRIDGENGKKINWELSVECWKD